MLLLTLFSIHLTLPNRLRAQVAHPNKNLTQQDDRLRALIQRMTLEEKVRMLSGGEQPGVSELPGTPRLGIPTMYPTDGPRGITSGTNTAFPAGVGLASSWDVGLLYDVGVVMGQEGRANGKTMVYAPAINIERDPLGGRFFEYLTEDPYLDGRLAIASVQGIQSQRVAACVKHFAANNREWNRDWYSSNVDERTLQEIYLPAFKAAVQEGGAWAVMTAANALNHQLACQNQWLLQKTLKDDWGFDGLVLTDYNHARGTKEAALAGLDISMPWGDWDTESFAKPLLNAVQDGTVPLSSIDDKVLRILRVRAATGLMDEDNPKSSGVTNTPEHQQIALRAAEESLVLLKNDGDVLPLDSRKLHYVAVLGPNADRRLTGSGVGGSSGVRPPFEVTVLEGLRKKLGNERVRYLPLPDAAFEPIDDRYLTSASGKPGIDAKYTNDGSDRTAVTRIEKTVDANWEMRSPDPAIIHTDNFSAQYSATLIPKETGFYIIQLSGENSSTLFVADQPFLTNSAESGFHRTTAGVNLVAGHRYPIKLQFHAGVGDASLHLEWTLPSSDQAGTQTLKDIAPVLKQADAVIFVGGWDYGQDNEGLDRQSMEFPDEQAKIIRSLPQLNPRTVVVLLHGSPFTMSGWLASVPAVLDGWYPGMEGGDALAAAITGDVNPAGKLPFTWPVDQAQSPTYALGTADRNNVNYKEGVFVGYRYFDTFGKIPQFPFGFGLSYSRFTFRALAVQRQGNRVHVECLVKNVSDRAGAEVVQLYVAPPKTDVPRPAHDLRGFTRVMLQPREEHRIVFDLGPDAFQHWDVSTHSWHREVGRFRIQVGNSSRNLPLQKAYVRK